MTPPPRQPSQRRAARHGISPVGGILLAVLVVLVVAAFVTARGVLNRKTAAVSSSSPPASALPSGALISVSITRGESAAAIAQDLQRQGLVPNSTVFLGYVKLKGGGNDFQPGVHQIASGASMDQIMRDLEKPVPPNQFKVTFPEGLRSEEDAATAAAAGIGTAKQFQQLVSHPDPSWNYSFLADKPKNASLEGYLFPDTYDLPAKSPTSGELVKRMLDDFNQRVTPALRQKIAANGHSLFDTLIIASIVEREAKVPSERPLIAGVYWNRLKLHQGLFADPTVQYAVGKPGHWWPQLSTQDLKVTSPYNTYLHVGLPPGPICNPGLASITAAANPKGNYLYFVAKNDGSGEHAFARTLAQHNANRAKYGQ